MAEIFKGYKVLSFPYADFKSQYREFVGKGSHYSLPLYRQIFQEGLIDPNRLATANAPLKRWKEIAHRVELRIPQAFRRHSEGETFKFSLELTDGSRTESVVIPMNHYKTLCVSSQIGCRRGCSFCETARMGLIRDLTPEEITVQLFAARFLYRQNIKNIVFMGMGEPLDNFSNLFRAIDVFRDQRGFAVGPSSMTLSTVGNVEAIDALADKVRQQPAYRRLKLAVSLNAADDATRSHIMPINRKFPLKELKQALVRYPIHHKRDFFFIEYVLIPGVNDSRAEAKALVTYLRDLPAVVNLIPYNPGSSGRFMAPSEQASLQFWNWLMESGQPCRLRSTKGRGIMAACGQLGYKRRSHGAKPVTTPSP